MRGVMASAAGMEGAWPSLNIVREDPEEYLSPAERYKQSLDMQFKSLVNFNNLIHVMPIDDTTQGALACSTCVNALGQADEILADRTIYMSPELQTSDFFLKTAKLQRTWYGVVGSLVIISQDVQSKEDLDLFKEYGSGMTKRYRRLRRK